MSMSSEYRRIEAVAGSASSGPRSNAAVFQGGLDCLMFDPPAAFTKEVIVGLQRRKVPVLQRDGKQAFELLERLDSKGNVIGHERGEPVTREEVTPIKEEIVVHEPRFRRPFRDEWCGSTQWSAEHVPLRIDGAGAGQGPCSCRNVGDGTDYLQEVYLRFERPALVAVSGRRRGRMSLNHNIPVQDERENKLDQLANLAGKQALESGYGLGKMEFDDAEDDDVAAVEQRMDALFATSCGGATGSRHATPLEVAAKEGRIQGRSAEIESAVTRATRAPGRAKHYVYLADGWPLRMIRRVEETIGGHRVDQMCGRMIDCILECSYGEGHKKLIRDMTSQVPPHLDEQERLEWLIARTGQPEVAYVPIPLSHTKSQDKALDLCCLQLARVQFDITFASWEQVLVRSRRDTAVLKADNMRPLESSDLGVMLVAKLGYLDDAEQDFLKEDKFDMLMVQHQWREFAEAATHLPVRWPHPTTKLFVVPQLKAADHQNEFTNTSNLIGRDIIKTMGLQTPTGYLQRPLDGSFWRTAPYLETCPGGPDPTTRKRIYSMSFEAKHGSSDATGSLNQYQWASTSIELQWDQSVAAKQYSFFVGREARMIARVHNDQLYLAYQTAS